MSTEGAFWPLVLLCMLLLFGTGFATAWGVRGARDAAALASARGELTTCTDAAQQQQHVIADMESRFAQQKAAAAAQQAQAAKLLDERDAALQAIAGRGERAAETVRKQGREDADSSVLARLAVPAAVAGQLWPATAASAGAATND